MTGTGIHLSRIGTSRGPVEFAVVGSGPPILYFHGTPCSSRLVIELEQQLIEGGFQLIVPHRPGYFGTPLGDRTTTADCSELAAHILNYLNVKRVAVMGTSGGGPPALAFAVRYPERTAASTLQCAQVHRWDDRRWAPILHPWLWECFRHSVPRWLFCRFFPILFRLGFPSTENYLRDLTGTRFWEVQAEPAAWRFAEGVYHALSEFRLERTGYYNDVSTWVREDVLSTGPVDCPALLLYDPQDPGVPFCHAEYAATKIPTAKTVSLNAGGHLIWFGHDADLMRRRRTEFLKENLAVA